MTEVPARGPTRGELRMDHIEAALAVLLCAGVQAFIPAELTVFGARWALPAVEVVLLVLLLVWRRQGMTRERMVLRVTVFTLVALLVVSTIASTFLLIRGVLSGDRLTGEMLVRAGIGIWITNVVAFAVVYWELDLGGPEDRAVSGRDGADFLFPQYDSTLVADSWTPLFADYLYTSFTNATAFSPTDTMPLRRRSKALMAIQSIVALITVAFIFARAVNILG